MMRDHARSSDCLNADPPALAAEAPVLVLNVVVRHSRNIGADNAVQTFLLNLFLVAGGKLLWRLYEEIEQFGDDLLRPLLIGFENSTEIKVLIEECLKLLALFCYLRAKTCQPFRVPAHIVHGTHSRRGKAGFSSSDQVAHHVVQYALQRLIELQFVRCAGIKLLDCAEKSGKERDAGAHLLQREYLRLQPVIQI